MNIDGCYMIDTKKTALLQAGFFTGRFEMRPGYEEAVEQFFAERSEQLAEISLTIADDKLILQTAEDADEFPIVDRRTEDDQVVLDIDCGGDVQSFRVHELGDDCIQLAGDEHELSEYAWGRAT